MPGQTRGTKRGRGANRGGRGRGPGARGRSNSLGGVGRQNIESFPSRGRNVKRGRGAAGQRSNEEGTRVKESGPETKEAPAKQPENHLKKVGVVKDEASQTPNDKQLVVKKSKKSPKKESDHKLSNQCEESPSGETLANPPTEVKMPELRKPETKPVVKNVKMKTAKMKTAKKSPSSVPGKNQIQSENVSLKTKSQEASINLDKESKLNISKNTSPAMNTSLSTGLKVFSITSSIPRYVFTTNDRAKLVRSIPGVVVINTASKGDQLIVGVDIEDGQLSRLLPKMEELKCWNVSRMDTTDRDTFSYFAGWKMIPRVDKSGMFQLIVNLRTQGWRSKDAEMRRRNQLLDLVKNFNITKIVHGEGETILLVSHVLECVAYSDLIRKEFTLEKRHTWHPKPVLTSKPQVHHPGQERHFWVKVKDPELNNLTTAHKQYTVFHQLSSAGKVLQLEHQLFGAEDNYLVVYSDLGDAKMPVLGQQFCLLELLPDALPDFYTPSYGVDAWGFYSVSGKFPEDVSDEARNRFAEDMKKVGAVGFRSGEVEDTFSLHFVNSKCLEQISHCAQFSSFRLTILSSLVRKTNVAKKLTKMVPSILKYKELKMGKDDEVVKQPTQESDSGAAKEEEGSKVISKKVDEESNPESVKVEMVKEDLSVAKEIKPCKKIKGMRENVKSRKEVETCVKNEGQSVAEVQDYLGTR